MKRPNISPAIRDLAVTSVASGVTFVSGVALIWLAGRLLGVTLLTEYLLLRRVASWVQPVLLLGIGVGLTRYVAFSRQKPREQIEYFASACLTILAFGTAFGVVAWLLRVPLGAALFGHASHSGLILPMVLLTVSAAINIATYGYFRGRLRMTCAAAVQIGSAAIPLVVMSLLFRTRSLAQIITATACVMFFFSLFVVIPTMSLALKVGGLQVGGLRLKRRVSELLRYGIPRVPGDLSTGTMYALGSIVASHFVPPPELAGLLLATSILVASSVSTEPLGAVLLSKASVLLADNRYAELREHLATIMSASIDMSIFCGIQLFVFSDVIVRAWVGPGVLSSVPIIRIIVIGVPFYLFFTALRSVIDAAAVVPINARNLILSLASQIVLIASALALCPRALLLPGIAASMVCSFAVLAFMTCRSLERLYSVRIQWRSSIVPTLFAIALGLIGAMLHGVAASSLQAFIVLESVFGASFLYLCYRYTAWAKLLYARISPERRTPTAPAGLPC